MTTDLEWNEKTAFYQVNFLDYNYISTFSPILGLAQTENVANWFDQHPCQQSN